MCKNKIIYNFLGIVTVLLLLSSCGSEKRRTYVKSSIDKIITSYLDEPNYSVILADMDYKEEDDSYYHKYRIIVQKPKMEVDTATLNDSTQIAKDVVVKNTNWEKVDPVLFEENVDNLGMTIVSKKDGVLDRKASPAGFDNYVGNERYGQWRTHSSGYSFWQFYGMYRFMGDIFYGPSYRYYRSDYRDYDRNYRGRRGYYGTNSSRRYGTNSKTAYNKSTRWSGKSSTFKSKVRNSVKRSAAASRSRSYSSGSSYSKTSRNSSRYSSSSTRSRGGGFGK